MNVKEFIDIGKKAKDKDFEHKFSVREINELLGEKFLLLELHDTPADFVARRNFEANAILYQQQFPNKAKLFRILKEANSLMSKTTCDRVFLMPSDYEAEDYVKRIKELTMD